MFPTAARIAADGTFTDADIEVAVEIFDSTNEGVARSYVLTGCSIDRSNGGADTVPYEWKLDALLTVVYLAVLYYWR